MLPEEAQRRWISGREIRPHPIGPENHPPSIPRPSGSLLAGLLRLWSRALRPPRVIVIRVIVMTEEGSHCPGHSVSGNPMRIDLICSSEAVAGWLYTMHAGYRMVSGHVHRVRKALGG